MANEMERQGTTNILNKNNMGAVLKSSLIPGTLVRSGSLFRKPSLTPSCYSERNSSTLDYYSNTMSNSNNNKDTSTNEHHEYYPRRESLVFSNAKRRLSQMYSNSTQGIQQGDLCERSSSKLTLDEELFDILHAFGETDITNIGGGGGGGNNNAKNEKNEQVMEDGGKPPTRQNLLDLIRQKREVINKLRCQPWDMSRKRRTLRLARKYLEQNESKVSKTHAIKEELTKAWFKFKRWFSNIHTYFIPWESKIKKIESHFGSVVSSYFTFLRWIVFMNLIITIIVVGFVVIPEVLADAAADNARKLRTASRKMVPENEVNITTKLEVIWQFDGYLKYSPLFYGYYSDDKYVGTKVKYALPLAYFVIVLLVFGYSLFAILRKVAANARLSKMAGSKSEQYIFNWKVFTGWDFSIGNSETASNSVMAVVIKLRESIAESKIQQKQKLSWLQVVTRVLTNVIIVGMLGASIYIIYFAVHSSATNTNQNVHDSSANLLSKNQVPSIVATITHVFPMIFDLIGKVENFHPRTALRFHLGRVLILYFINYATLIIALFDKLDNIREVSITGEGPIFDEIPLEGEMFLRLRRQLGSMNNKLGKFSAEASRTSPRKNFTWKAFLNYMENTVVPIIDSGEVERGKIIKNDNKNKTNGDLLSDNNNFTIYPKNLTTKIDNKTFIITTTPTTTITTTITSTTQFIEEELRSLTTTDKDISIIAGLRAYKLNVSIDKPKFKNKKAQKIIQTNPLPTLKSLYTPKLMKFRTTTKGPRASQWEGRKKTKNPKFATSTPRSIKYNKTIEDKKNAKYKTAIVFRKPTTDNLPHKVKESYVLPYLNGTNDSEKICWETMIGQEIVRLVTMDLYITIASIFVIDFLRGLWVRYCSPWWFWDLETIFPEYGEFKVAENVLHIINNQGMIWLGLFFAPLLPAINNIKLIILMYIRGWTVMTCNVPASEIFRDSRSSNFYLMVLLIWLLLCTVPVGFVIASKRPSSSCGPFAGSDTFYKVVTQVLEEKVDPKLLKWFRFLVSPGVIIPIMLVLFLTIYFLVSLVRGLREANSDLKQQLIHERTEEKKKIFELAGGGAKKKEGFFDTLKNGNTIFPGDSTNKGRKKSGKKEILKIHVCDLEEKKREPWRIYNGTINDESLIPSDERDEINDLKNIPTPPSTREGSFTNLINQGTSNNILKNGKRFKKEDEELSPEDKSNFENKNIKELGKSGHRYSVVIPIPHRQNHLSESINEDDFSSIVSDVNVSKKNIPLSCTPDDVKSLMKNFQSTEYLNNTNSVGLSLASFPTVLSNSNLSANDLTVVFQSSSGKHNPSRSASIKIGGSITSLDTPKFLPLSVRKNSTSCKNLETSKGNVIKNDKILTTIDSEMEQHYYSKMEEEGDGNRKGDDLIKSVFQPKKVVDTFQPWPSIEEVRNKRSSLQSIKDKVNEEGKKKFSYNDYPLSVSKNGNDIGKTVMELKSFTEMVNNKKSDKKSNKKSDKKIKEEDNNIEKISKTVPLKKKSIFSKGNLISTAIATASHGADFLLGKSGREKEDEVCLTKEIDKPSKSHSDSVKRMAPTVEFGDDDSPRVALN
uniref:TMC domain-containing protein n=1 Tax=Strongyloides stercoralis TaxID=6248 RepID=A0A913HXW6_STRER